MTEQLYRTDAYLRDCTARVLAVNADNFQPNNYPPDGCSPPGP